MAETRTTDTIDRNLALVCNARQVTIDILAAALDGAEQAKADAERHIAAYDQRITELLDERLGT